MNVLAVGSDKSIFNFKSESARRQVAYGTRLGELHIIVYTLRRDSLAPVHLSAETHVYPTASRSKILYGWDAFRIARHIQKPDVVTVQDPFESGLIGWIIARTRSARFHVQIHTDLFSPHFGDSVLNRLRQLCARFVLSRAERIRVVSERIKKSIEKRTNAPITVLPIYIDVARFRDAKPGELASRFKQFSTKFLVVARLEKEKNVALAIDAFAKAAPSDSCLIILGEGSEQSKLTEQVAALGISSRVFFEGAHDPAPYCALADCVLVPSRYEGYGRVIIEALAAGKPVIACDVGIAREAGAIVVTPDHFKDALKEWTRHGPRAARLQEYAYQSFDEYIAHYAQDIVDACD